MTRRGGPETLEAVLTRLLSSMGLPTPDLIPRLERDWGRVAGPPWADQSTPVVMKGGELVIEARARELVSILRYATGDLLRRLDEELGAGRIESIRVVAPRRS